MLYKTADDGAWSTYHSADNWHLLPVAPPDREMHYGVKSSDNKEVETSGNFTLGKNELVYRINIRNTSDKALTIGSLSLPLYYNRLAGENPKQIFEERVLKHHFISGRLVYPPITPNCSK